MEGECAVGSECGVGESLDPFAEHCQVASVAEPYLLQDMKMPEDEMADVGMIFKIFA